jgi:hypothetical protein
MVGSTGYAVSPGTIWALVVGVLAFVVIVVALWVGLARTRTPALRTLLMGTALIALLPVGWLVADALALIVQAVHA